MVKHEKPPLEEWLTTTQAAERLGVTKRYLRALVKAGRFEGRLLAGRLLVNPDSLEGWTRKRKRRKDKPIE